MLSVKNPVRMPESQTRPTLPSQIGQPQLSRSMQPQPMPGSQSDNFLNQFQNTARPPMPMPQQQPQFQPQQQPQFQPQFNFPQPQQQYRPVPDLNNAGLRPPNLNNTPGQMGNQTLPPAPGMMGAAPITQPTLPPGYAPPAGPLTQPTLPPGMDQPTGPITQPTGPLGSAPPAIGGGGIMNMPGIGNGGNMMMPGIGIGLNTMMPQNLYNQYSDQMFNQMSPSGMMPQAQY